MNVSNWFIAYRLLAAFCYALIGFAACYSVYQSLVNGGGSMVSIYDGNVRIALFWGFLVVSALLLLFKIVLHILELIWKKQTVFSIMYTASETVTMASSVIIMDIILAMWPPSLSGRPAELDNALSLVVYSTLFVWSCFLVSIEVLTLVFLNPNYNPFQNGDNGIVDAMAKYWSWSSISIGVVFLISFVLAVGMEGYTGYLVTKPNYITDAEVDTWHYIQYISFGIIAGVNLFIYLAWQFRRVNTDWSIREALESPVLASKIASEADLSLYDLVYGYLFWNSTFPYFWVLISTSAVVLFSTYGYVQQFYLNPGATPEQMTWGFLPVGILHLLFIPFQIYYGVKGAFVIFFGEINVLDWIMGLSISPTENERARKLALRGLPTGYLRVHDAGHRKVE